MWSKLKNSGFSLVETLIAMALLVGAISLGMNSLDQQSKSRSTRTKQTMHRYIAIQVTQHINANVATYPPIIPANTSDKIVYYGCLTKDGMLIGNKFIFKLATNFDEKVPFGQCPQDLTAYEARFYWSNSVPDEVRINLLTLQTGTAAFLAVHNFKIFAK
jgi:prepilin-type N-terminal cleavage/methylation domain-containing protein